MQRTLVVGLLLALVFVSACGSKNNATTASGKQELEPINLGVVSCCTSGTEIALWLAMDEGLFEKNGLKAKMSILPPPTGVQAMLAGDVQIGTAPGNAISAFAGGLKDLVWVAGNHSWPTYRIMSKTLKNPEDIKGKTLAVSGMYAPPAIAAMNYYEKKFNLKAERDYKVVPFNSIGDILPAFEQGLVDAAVLSTPLHLKAQNLGGKVLVDLAQTFSEANAWIMTTRTFAKKNPEAVLRFLRAYSQAIALMKAKPDVAIKSIMKNVSGITEAEAKTTYDDYVHLADINMAPDALVPYQTYTDVQQTRTVNPLDMMDYSFLKELDKSGFLKEQGLTFKLPAGQ